MIDPEKIKVLCNEEGFRWVSLLWLRRRLNERPKDIRTALGNAGWIHVSARALALPTWWPGSGRQGVVLRRGFVVPGLMRETAEARLIRAALTIFEEHEDASVSGLIELMLKKFAPQVDALGDDEETRGSRLKRALAKALAKRGVKSVHIWRNHVTLDPETKQRKGAYVRGYRREDLVKALEKK